MDEQNIAKIFKALGNVVRLKIMYCLLDGEKCVCEIVKDLNYRQCVISSHLTKLEDLGIIKSRREGKYVFYKITNQKIKNILESIRGDRDV